MSVAFSRRTEARRPGPGPWRRGRRLLFYAAVRGLAEGLRRSPRPVGRSLLRGLGWTAWVLLGREREIARRQLAVAFPELGVEARERLGRESLQCLGENLLDCVRGDAAVRVPVAAEERLRSCRNRRRPVLVLMGHVGAFELVGGCLAERLAPFGALTANPHNRRVDRWLRAERRARGVRVFDRSRERWAAARWLRRGGTLAVLADHRGAVQNVDAPWFGRSAPTPVGPARLARWADALVLPVTMRREGAGLTLHVEEPLLDAAARSEDDVVAWCNRQLEDWIRRSPREWTWFHDRYGERDA